MDVLVLAAARGTEPSSGAREGLGLGRRLAQTSGGKVAAGVIGCSVEGEPYVRFGADEVITVSDEGLGEYDPDAYVDAAHAVCAAARPDLIVIPGDHIGWELAPRLAYRLEAGLVTDCVGVELVDGTVRFTKPVYGGKAMARIAVRSDVQMALLRPRAVEPAAEDANRTGEVISLDFTPGAHVGRTRIVGQVADDEGEGGVSLEDARTVIAGGRGLGGPEPFEQLHELARVLHGAVGASLAAVDAGWVPAAYQIGQTGKAIAPDLYIAVGISGASQHVAGIGSAKTIVAINRDAEAPIFNVAHLGVVGDYKEVIPAFTEEVRRLLRG